MKLFIGLLLILIAIKIIIIYSYVFTNYNKPFKDRNKLLR